MNQEALLGALSLMIVAAINAATYFLTRRPEKQDTKDANDDAQDTKDPKAAATEFSKTYVDDLILQLQSRIEECKKRADTAEGLAKAANEQIALLTPRTTDLENQVIDLQAQVATQKQEITRVEGERDTAIAERNTLQHLPEQGGRKAIGDFVELLIVAVDKRWPLPTAASSPAIGDEAVADAGSESQSEEAA